MDSVIVYTDGGCSGNPGPGGWAYVIKMSGQDSLVQKGSAGDPHTTNNKMELTAVIEALKAIGTRSDLRDLPIQMNTDSMYVKNGITSWIRRWEKNGWRNAAKKPVKNKELWVELSALASTFDIAWQWVTAHNGIELNELCDAMVQEQTRAQLHGH